MEGRVRTALPLGSGRTLQRVIRRIVARLGVIQSLVRVACGITAPMRIYMYTCNNKRHTGLLWLFCITIIIVIVIIRSGGSKANGIVPCSFILKARATLGPAFRARNTSSRLPASFASPLRVLAPPEPRRIDSNATKLLAIETHSASCPVHGEVSSASDARAKNQFRRHVTVSTQKSTHLGI